MDAPQTKRQNNNKMKTVLTLPSDIERYALFPIKYHDIWDYYKKQVAVFWVPEEIDLSSDINDWKSKLTDDERYFIKHILAFFAVSDSIVADNICTRFINEIDIQEVSFFYSIQMTIENIHAETYSLLVDTFIEDKDEKMKLFDAMKHIPSIQKKGMWALRWMNSDASFGERLVAFAVMEGVFFSGCFCSIFWLKKRSLMNGLTFSNELISRDEGLHRDFACLLFSYLLEKPSQERVFEIVSNAVEIEKEFLSTSFSSNLIGLNPNSLHTYIEYVADHLLLSLGFETLYKSRNPFEWMEIISLNGKTNFFERRVSDYSKVKSTLSKEFTTDANF